MTFHLIRSGADVSSLGWVRDCEGWVKVSPTELVLRWISKFGATTELSLLRKELWTRLSVRGKNSILASKICKTLLVSLISAKRVTSLAQNMKG